MKIEPADYRTNLIESINTLIAFERALFPAAINVLMKGELKGIDDAFEIDDSYDFTMDHILSSEDTNVKKLAKTIKKIRKTISYLIAINNVTEIELDWA